MRYNTLKAKIARLLNEKLNKIPTLYCSDIPIAVTPIKSKNDAIAMDF
jgi:hypothetical protein